MNVPEGEGEAIPTPSVPLESIESWTHDCEVLIVGHGGAGAAAAIEAARAGVETLILERMTRGGGATALSTGVIYFGGGTRIQRECGFEDSIEEMRKHVRLAAGADADDEKVRLYCEGSPEHFEWFCDLGVEWKPSFVAEKTTHPFEDDCLFYSGNELVHPFVEEARPAPRGHKPARKGEAGGYLMECLIQGTRDAGAAVLNDCRVDALVQRDDGRIVGAVGRCEGERLTVKARRGVILCAGGFVMNDAMLAQYAPSLLRCNWKAASPGDDGRGIHLGMAAGGEAVNMDEGLVLNAYYPPGAHLKGILVDEQGKRFINEDSYLGRTSDAILHRANGRAWLIVDDELYGPTQALHKLAAVEGSFEELERALGMPEGNLVETIDVYNRDAARGEDPRFRKAPEYLRPLSAPPYAALDCTTENSIFGVFTLGGLATRATGEVLAADGSEIPGLFAAGRNSAGLILEGRTYASGLSIGDATFFGRLAGRRAANSEAWE